MKNKMNSKTQTIIFCFTIIVVIVAIWLLTLFASMFVVAFVLLKLLGGEVSGRGEYGVMAGGWAILLGFLISPLSLIPSYKLSLKLAKTFQSRGWEIRNPKKLFWVSVGLLFLPIILLALLGALLQ